MPPVARAIALLVGLALLASCAGSTVRTINYSPPQVTESAREFVGWAGASGPVLITIRNNPYPAPSELVAGVLAEAASGSIIGLPAVGFAVDPRQARHPEWRVVYAFNVHPALATAAACNPDQQAPPEPGGQGWYALVVFCNETRPIVSAGAWTAPLPGPNTPEFRSFAVQTIQELFVSNTTRPLHGQAFFIFP